MITPAEQFEDFLKEHWPAWHDVAVSRRMQNQLAGVSRFIPGLQIPTGVPVDDQVAEAMNTKMEHIIKVIVNLRMSALVYAVTRDCKVDAKSSTIATCAPDAVLHLRDQVPFTEGQLNWGSVALTFDFSPHVTVNGNVDEKHLSWASAIRSSSSRAIVVGLAFDADKYHLWAVKDNEPRVLIKSASLSIGRKVTGSGVMAPFDPSTVNAQACLVLALSIFALSDSFFMEKPALSS